MRTPSKTTGTCTFLPRQHMFPLLCVKRLDRTVDPQALSRAQFLAGLVLVARSRG